MRDYSINEAEEIDEALDNVEEIYKTLITDHDLNNARIERWRWGEPAITLSWEADDDISRNIRAQIEINGIYKLNVEVNAWRDIIKSTSGERIRHWRHDNIDEVPPRAQKMEAAIEDRAFLHATQLDEGDLTQRKKLS